MVAHLFDDTPIGPAALPSGVIARLLLHQTTDDRREGSRLVLRDQGTRQEEVMP